MKEQSLKRQAMLTAASGAAVRAMGFALRLWVSRMLGAEAVGVMELAGGAQMLAVTAASAGLPGAVSRLSARGRTEEDRIMALYAGRRMAARLGLILSPLFFLGAPWIARWLGDGRTLPALLLFSPYLFLNAVSSVYDGYCFGRGRALPPAVSELAEQIVRLAVTAALSVLAARMTAAYRAALPAFAASAGALAGLAVMPLMVGRVPSFRQSGKLKIVRSRLWRLGLPLTLNRLAHTGLRTLSGVIIPLRLMAAGLSKAEAMSRFGMLSGMVLPLMLLPGLFSGALAAVGGPAAARCRTAETERRLEKRLLLSALGLGIACAAGLYVLAPILARRLYRLPELAGLIRRACPLAVMTPLQQVAGGLMTGLGLQKKALAASLLGAAATLLCTWQWTALPRLGIDGALYASLLGHGLTLFCSLLYLWGHNCRSSAEKRFTDSR